MPNAMAPPRRLNHDQIAADYVNRLDLSVEALAELHGCTTLTIGRIVRRRGLSNTVRSTYRYDHDAIAADYSAGIATVTQIARRNGCDETTVYDIARGRDLRRTGRSVNQ